VQGKRGSAIGKKRIGPDFKKERSKNEEGGKKRERVVPKRGQSRTWPKTKKPGFPAEKKKGIKQEKKTRLCLP